MSVKIFTKSQESEARAFVSTMGARIDSITVTFDKLEVWYV